LIWGLTFGIILDNGSGGEKNIFANTPLCFIDVNSLLRIAAPCQPLFTAISVMQKTQISAIAIGVLLAITLMVNFAPVRAADTSQLEYRVRRLESEISRLGNQISQLRFQSSGTPRVEVVPRPELPENVPPEGMTRWLSGDPMFDNLATLTIELKQDVIDIRERLSALEAKIEN